jgi:predicted nuclease of restriction endonuclease-like (RecB) superfamily
MSTPRVPAGYPAWLADLKTQIREARLRATLVVNSELIGLYWRIGREILERQAEQGWGSKIVGRLAIDLRAAFPDTRDFSPANLRYMKAFAEAWPDPAMLQRVVGKLPWGQNMELLAVKDSAARLWYSEATLEHGWSRPVLGAQIDTQAHARHGKALTNFARTPPPETSDLAQQALKDPCQFDFLTLRQAARERDVERGLITRFKDPLLELGKGFSFIASQHHLEVGGQDFYVALLFYHRRLRCLVAVDLKTGPFRPEHAGKMNFYLAALDEPRRLVREWRADVPLRCAAGRRPAPSLPAELLAHTSPLMWEHIGFSGDFLWDRAAATAGHRRPLNLERERSAA